MPRSSERQNAISLVEGVVEDLRTKLLVQNMQDEGYIGLLEDEIGYDADQQEVENLREEADAMHVTGNNIVNALNEYLATIINSRYAVDRRAWRGLRAVREDILEYYFTMDENWFREQVCIGFMNPSYEV